MVEAQTPWDGDGRYDRRPSERAASAILSLFDAPGGVAFSYVVRIKSMTTHIQKQKKRKKNNYPRANKLDSPCSFFREFVAH
jgi:hypothetical protein